MRQSQLSADLLAAYSKTSYRVTTPRGEFVVRIGICSPDLDSLLGELNERQWAIITGHNPGSQLTNRKANIATQRRLLAEVEAMALDVFETLAVSGDDSWPTEPGVLIVGITHESAREIAIRYGQNAIVEGKLRCTAELITFV